MLLFVLFVLGTLAVVTVVFFIDQMVKLGCQPLAIEDQIIEPVLELSAIAEPAAVPPKPASAIAAPIEPRV